MKRSRVFLGMTTAVLAIVGVAVAKRTPTPIIRYYYTLKNGIYCNTVLSLCTTEVGALTCFATVTDGTVIHSQVIVPVYTHGPKSLNSPSRCTRLIKYNGTL